MNTHLKKLGWLALGAWLTLPVGSEATKGQGPVREGLRRTGEATRNVVGGVAEGTANAVRRTGEAAQNLGQGTRDAIRGTSQPYRGEYGAGYRGDVQNNGAYVDGQIQNGNQQNRNQAQYGNQGQAQFQQGYQAPMSSNRGMVNSGAVYQLRHDATGREFICVCGQRVYFTSQASYQQPQAAQDSQAGRDEAMNRETYKPDTSATQPEAGNASDQSQRNAEDRNAADNRNLDSESQNNARSDASNRQDDVPEPPRADQPRADQPLKDAVESQDAINNG